MKHVVFGILFTLLAVTASPLSADGEVYRWTDENGRVHYGDHNLSRPESVRLPLATAPSPADVKLARERTRQIAESLKRSRKSPRTRSKFTPVNTPALSWEAAKAARSQRIEEQVRNARLPRTSVPSR